MGERIAGETQTLTDSQRPINVQMDCGHTGYKLPQAKVTAGLNIHLSNAVSTRHYGGSSTKLTFMEELQLRNLLWRRPTLSYGRIDATIIKPGQLVIRRMWKNGRVYVFKIPKQAYHPNCLLTTIKCWVDSAKIWALMSRYSVDPLFDISDDVLTMVAAKHCHIPRS